MRVELAAHGREEEEVGVEFPVDTDEAPVGNFVFAFSGLWGGFQLSRRL